jgi:phosphoribosylformylglycinamidine synthase
VGILENVDDAVASHFREAGSTIFLLSGTAENSTTEAEFGSSEYAKEVLGQIWGVPPALEIKQEAALQKCIRELIQEHAIESAHDCSDGGLAIALAEASFGKIGDRAASTRVGAEIDLKSNGIFAEGILFGETASRVVISCDQKKAEIIKQLTLKWGVRAVQIGHTVPEKLEIRIDGKLAVSEKVSELKNDWDTALTKALHTESAEHLVPEILQKS